MSKITLDRPWHRPGAFAYARTRIPAALRPPVTVYPMPADVAMANANEVWPDGNDRLSSLVGGLWGDACA